MSDIELRTVNQSGELVAINLDGTADGKQVLTKEQIDALVNGKFGDYSFDGRYFNVDSKPILYCSSTSMIFNYEYLFNIIFLGETIRFIDLTIPIIDSAADSSAITKEWALAKFTTPADVDGKFGLYTFDTDEMAISGDVVLSKNGTNLIIGGDAESITFLLSIASIDAASGISAVTKEWTLAKFFQQSQFINDFTGTSAQPILTDLNGKIASSLLPTQAAPQGNFTPTGGQEYPTLSGNVAGDYWIVNNVGAGYTFTGGDLVGEMVYESAWMVLDVNLNWILSNNYAGTVQAAWGSIIGTLTEQIDLNNALGLKADQLDLDTTNSNVSSNTVAISSLGTDLDTTNTNVATNADDIDANTIAIGLRATQADLDTTNTNVSNNATAIGDKVDQTDLDATNTNVSTNTTNISSNTTAISGKLDDVTAGANVTIDKTNPLNPVISASGGGGDSSFITPEDYGAVGNGVTDDYTALLNFFNALSAGNQGLMGSKKNYRTTQPITVNLSGDAIFDGNGSSVVIDYADANAFNNGRTVLFKTPVAVSKNLTVNAPKGVTTMTLSDTSGIELGMGLWLPNGYWVDVNSAMYKEAMAIVTSIDGNTIQFDCPLPTNFDVLYSATDGAPKTTQCVVQFSYPYKIIIDNFGCGAIGNIADATILPLLYWSLRLDRAFYPRLTNCFCHGGGRAVLGLYQVYGAIVDGFWNDNAEVTVYGLYWNVLVNSVIRNSFFKSQTPAISSDAGCSYGNVFDNVNPWGWRTHGFDVHGALDNKITNSKINSLVLDSGDMRVTNSDIYGVTNYALVGGKYGNDLIPTRTVMENCDFYPIPEGALTIYGRRTSSTSGSALRDYLLTENCRFHGETFLFGDRSIFKYKNVTIIPDDGEAYKIPDTDYSEAEFLNKPHYNNFTSSAPTTLDLGVIGASSGWTIQGNYKLNGTAQQTIWGSVNAQYFTIAMGTKARLRYRQADGTYQDFESDTITDPFNVWKNLAVTLKSNGDGTAYAVFYINGRQIWTNSNIAWTTFYAGLANPFTFGGQPGFGGAIQNTLFFDRPLSMREVNYYANDMDRGYSSDAIGVWLEQRTRNTWVDESGNGYDAVIHQASIPTTDLVSRSAAKYIPYDNTVSGTTAEDVQTTLDELEARP